MESCHIAKCLVKDLNGRIILSSDNDQELIYPRSAIKIFQALPFINSGAHKKFGLSEKILAISCSSHCGELKHLKILNNWLKKINLPLESLKCGIHSPINLKSSNDLYLSGHKPSQLHNNCSGKHLAMLSGCLSNKMQYENYLDVNHPYQKLIRDSLEYFTVSSIQKKNIGRDECSAPQYAFSIENLTNAMINLIKNNNNTSYYSKAISKLLNAIKKYPVLIGGTGRFDSEIIKHTQGRIFCKGGAEGVLLFADFRKKIGGAIKIIDGNERAIPPLTIKIFSRLKLLTIKEMKHLNKWRKKILYNHTNKKIGKIYAKLMQ